MLKLTGECLAEPLFLIILHSTQHISRMKRRQEITPAIIKTSLVMRGLEVEKRFQELRGWKWVQRKVGYK